MGGAWVWDPTQKAQRSPGGWSLHMIGQRDVKERALEVGVGSKGVAGSEDMLGKQEDNKAGKV